MGATPSSRSILLLLNYSFRQELSQATFPPWQESLGRGLQGVQGRWHQADRTADQSVPLPSQEHRATQKEDGMKVSSIATTSSADRFFPAMIWDHLTSSPGTLQPKKGSSLEASLIQAGSQGVLNDSFSKSGASISSSTYFQQPLTTLLAQVFLCSFNKLQRN